MAGGGKHTWQSGSGTGSQAGDVGGGRPETGGEDPCDISFETTLNSVNAVAIESVSRGSRLKLTPVAENGSERLVAKLGEVTIGVISHPKTLDLIACIRSNNSYVATVSDRTGSLCRVRVQRQL